MAVTMLIAACDPAAGQFEGEWADGLTDDVWAPADHGEAAPSKAGQASTGAAAYVGEFPGFAVCNAIEPCAADAQPGLTPVLCMDFSTATRGDDLSELYLNEPNAEVVNRIRIGAFPVEGPFEGAVLDHDPDVCDEGTFMAFDSANPTGGDPDLGTPNEMYGGPGVGAGGASNDTPLGMVGILSEDDDPDDPDDDAAGALFHVDFRVGFTEPGSPQPPLGPPLCVQSFDLIDVETQELTMAVVKTGERDATPDELSGLVIDITGAGNNAVNRVWVNQCGVHSITVGNSASVAIDNIVVCHTPIGPQ